MWGRPFHSVTSDFKTKVHFLNSKLSFLLLHTLQIPSPLLGQLQLPRASPAIASVSCQRMLFASKSFCKPMHTKGRQTLTQREGRSTSGGETMAERTGGESPTAKGSFTWITCFFCTPTHICWAALGQEPHLLLPWIYLPPSTFPHNHTQILSPGLYCFLPKSVECSAASVKQKLMSTVTPTPECSDCLLKTYISPNLMNPHQ